MNKVPKSISYVCKFNPDKDIEEVVPDLAVNVGEIMVTGVVASTGDTTPYTKETEISEIGHYITDKISGAIAAMNLNKSLSAAVQEPKPVSTPKGDN